MDGKDFILDKVVTNQTVILTNNEHFQGFFINFKEIYFLGDLLIPNSEIFCFKLKEKRGWGVLNDC